MGVRCVRLLAQVDKRARGNYRIDARIAWRMHRAPEGPARSSGPRPPPRPLRAPGGVAREYTTFPCILCVENLGEKLRGLFIFGLGFLTAWRAVRFALPRNMRFYVKMRFYVRSFRYRVVWAST